MKYLLQVIILGIVAFLLATATIWIPAQLWIFMQMNREFYDSIPHYIIIGGQLHLIISWLFLLLAYAVILGHIFGDEEVVTIDFAEEDTEN